MNLRVPANRHFQSRLASLGWLASPSPSPSPSPIPIPLVPFFPTPSRILDLRSLWPLEEQSRTTASVFPSIQDVAYVSWLSLRSLLSAWFRECLPRDTPGCHFHQSLRGRHFLPSRYSLPLADPFGFLYTSSTYLPVARSNLLRWTNLLQKEAFPPVSRRYDEPSPVPPRHRPPRLSTRGPPCWTQERLLTVIVSPSRRRAFVCPFPVIPRPLASLRYLLFLVSWSLALPRP